MATLATPGVAVGSDVAQVRQLMTCALQAWVAYCTACFSARGLDDLLRANANLVGEGVTLVSHAAAARQAVHGVVTPTLNDA